MAGDGVAPGAASSVRSRRLLRFRDTRVHAHFAALAALFAGVNRATFAGGSSP